MLGAALAAGAGHRRELLLRHGRPVRQRHDGQRHRRAVRRSARHGLRPDQPGFYNGGDLAGVTRGSTTSRASARRRSGSRRRSRTSRSSCEDGPSAGYHGYWVTDFTQIDPHLGTNAGPRALVDAAHDRGMKVYFDIITNHTADVIGYQEGARSRTSSKDAVPYRTAAGDAVRRPRLRRDGHASRRSTRRRPSRTSRSWTRRDAERQGAGLAERRDALPQPRRHDVRRRELAVRRLLRPRRPVHRAPEVVNGMIDIYQTWIRDFGIDGFRIDTMKHVNDEFWQEFGPEVLAVRPRAGKPEFFMFGEVARRHARPFTSHYTTHNTMQSVLDFPFQGAARDFASRGQPASDLAALLRQRRLVHRRRLERLPAADVPRQPRHRPVRRLPAGRQPRRRRRRAARAGPAGARADVPLPRQSGRLLRRRAGLRRRRRRPGRPADDVRQPGPGVPRRRPARHRRDPRAGQLRPRASAVPGDPRARRGSPRDHPALRNGAQQNRLRRATAPASTRSPGSTASEQREYVVA